MTSVAALHHLGPPQARDFFVVFAFESSCSNWLSHPLQRRCTSGRSALIVLLSQAVGLRVEQRCQRGSRSTIFRLYASKADEVLISVLFDIALLSSSLHLFHSTHSTPLYSLHFTSLTSLHPFHSLSLLSVASRSSLFHLLSVATR